MIEKAEISHKETDRLNKHSHNKQKWLKAVRENSCQINQNRLCKQFKQNPHKDASTEKTIQINQQGKER